MIEGHSYWNMRGAVRDTAGQRLKGSLFVFSQLEADTALLIEDPGSNAGPPAMRCFESESGFLENDLEIDTQNAWTSSPGRAVFVIPPLPST